MNEIILFRSTQQQMEPIHEDYVSLKENFYKYNTNTTFSSSSQSDDEVFITRNFALTWLCLGIVSQIVVIYYLCRWKPRE